MELRRNGVNGRVASASKSGRHSRIISTLSSPHSPPLSSWLVICSPAFRWHETNQRPTQAKPSVEMSHTARRGRRLWEGRFLLFSLGDLAARLCIRSLRRDFLHTWAARIPSTARELRMCCMYFCTRKHCNTSTEHGVRAGSPEEASSAVYLLLLITTHGFRSHLRQGN